MSFLEAWIVPAEATVSAVPYILTAITAVLLVAASKGGFGGGAGVISVPLMLQIARADFVIGAWLPVLIVCDTATVRHYPKIWSWQAVRQLVPGMVVGILLATLFLRMANSNPKLFGALLQLGVGLISLAFVILQAPAVLKSGRKEAPLAPPTESTPTERVALAGVSGGTVAAPMSPPPGAGWQPTWIVSLPVGLLIGISTMIAHAAGPISTMYVLPQKLDQRTFAGTIGWTFFVVNISKVPFSILAGAMSWHTLQYGLWMMLVAPLGVWLGVKLNRYLSPVVFLRMIYVFLVIAAIKLMTDAAITFSQPGALS